MWAARADFESTRLAVASDLPRIVLWAWDRPEDLRWLDPRCCGVAFLARTLRLRGGEVLIRRRVPPLRVGSGTGLVAVTRIEVDRRVRPSLSEGQRLGAAAEIAATAGLLGVRAVQVDFDAAASERTFYRELLAEVRKRLPASVRLSMTALASWCFEDRWLGGLPVEEAVPMLFRMGVDGPLVLRRLKARRGFSEALCKHSLGLSTDETAVLPWIPHGRRLYLFHPAAWSEAALQNLLSEVSLP
jgi:hypothetical protein